MLGWGDVAQHKAELLLPPRSFLYFSITACSNGFRPFILKLWGEDLWKSTTTVSLSKK